MERRNTTEDGLDPLAKGVVDVIGDHLDDPAGIDRGGSRSFAFMAARMARRQARRRTTLIAFAGTSCLLAVIAVWLAPRLGDRPHAALTYTLNGEPPPRGGYIAPSAHEPVLSFSDGTRVALEPTARARVVELDRHGARIALDEGKAHVEVAHLPGADWRFEAGPFAINVHGTKFSFGWNTRLARLDVQMDSGVVSVSGPLSGGEIFLRAGQTLSVSLNDEGAAAVTPAVGEAGTGAISPPPGPPTPAVALPELHPSDPAARPTARSDSRFDSPEGWAAKLAAGKAAAVVADAERRGLAKVLDGSSSEDLAALADASRFEKNDGLARRALLAQRRRFPRSVRAREASFLLGRLDDASGDGTESALGWYDQYLDEAPGGAYVSEALGRKMMDFERTHRHAEATAVAADYLRRFPSGILLSRGRGARPRTMTKSAAGPRPVAVALAAVLLGAFGRGSSARAASGVVVLLEAGAGSPAQRRCLTRIREELLAGGFDVAVVDPGPGNDPLSVAEAVTRQHDSAATIALLGDPDLGPAELWILDRIGPRPEVRRIKVPNDDPDRIPEVLAIRTIELLRASALSLLVESNRPAPPLPPPASPPPPVAAPTRPPPAPVVSLPERRDRIGVEAGIAALESLDGPGPAMMPIARVRVPLAWPLFARLTFAGFGTRPRVSTSLGTADITQAFGLLEIGAVFRRHRRLNPVVMLGAGTIDVRSAGAGVYPYQGIEESEWSALIDCGVGLVARLGVHLSTAFELHASLAAPHPVIRFSGTDAATIGRPALLASWTLITWL